MKWRKPSAVKRPDVQRVELGAPPEDLSGSVHGQTASDLEERCYRAILNNGVDDADITFQPSYVAGRNIPGEIRPDFAVDVGTLLLIFVDEEYFHKSAPDARRDEINDAILFQRFDGAVQYPVRIPGDELETQEVADQILAEVLAGG